MLLQSPLIEKSDSKRVIEIDATRTFCGDKIGFKIGFKFTEQSIDSLLQLLSSMSHLKDDFRRTLLIDDCFKDIPAMKMILLGKAANQKINFKYTEQSIQRIESQIKNSDALRNPNKYH